MTEPYTGDRGKRVIVPITLADGTQAYIEARADETESRRELVAGTKSHRFEAVAASIRTLSTELKDAMLSASPHEAELEFGLEVKTQSGGLVALFVTADVSATFKITLRWKRDPAES